MSYQLLKEDVLFYQRFLKSAGFYSDSLDGKWGPNTDKADADFSQQSKSIAIDFGTFDSRSESNIITLMPKAQIAVRKFLKLASATNKHVRIISGTRTYAEQDVLYAKGRNGNPGHIVTRAKGGESNHNFGIAWDIGLFDGNGTYNTNDTDYIALAHEILPGMDNIEWGGNWNSIKDYPHYQLKAASESVSVVRELFEKGAEYA